MDYSTLVDSYIKQSGMSLAEISEKMKKEKGVKVDRTYISKLRKSPKYAASEDINRALAEVTGGDPDRLVWAGLVYGSHPSVREAMTLIDTDVITKAMKLSKRFPNYFHLTDESQEEIENEHDVQEFWKSFNKSLEDAQKAYESRKPPVDYDLILTNPPFSGVKESPELYFKNSLVQVPLLGSIQAGSAIEMVEYNEGYTLVDPNVLNGKDGFALRVKGDSMSGDRIQDGDIVIVAKQEEVSPHEIAVVAINGDHATLKRVKPHGDICMLVPSNPSMEPQIVPAKDVHIIGKVVEVKFWPK